MNSVLSFQLSKKYIIESEVSKSLLSRFYKAKECGGLKRTVGIKEWDIHSKEERTSIENEVGMMASLASKHVHVPHVYELYISEQSSKAWAIMEWIDGDALDSLLFDDGTYLSHIIALCDILAVMEKKNWEHKDIKPQNILIEKNTHQLYLLDFGLSASLPNKIDGTQNFKAPEMREDTQNLDRSKVDMFSIGVMLYKQFTGDWPIFGEDYWRLPAPGSKKWSDFTKPQDKKPDISPKINAIIIKCMQYDPKERYANYYALKKALIDAKRNLKRKNA